MPDTARMPPRRAAELPDSSRLMSVCADRSSARTPLDFLAAAFAVRWRTRLGEGDRPPLGEADAAATLIATTDGIADLAHTFDLEAVWQLDARPVEPVEDGPTATTLGEIVASMTLYDVASRRWPDVEPRTGLDMEAARYDQLVRGIVDLGGLQPWRHSQGTPDLDLDSRIKILTSLLHPGESLRAPLLTTPSRTTGGVMSIAKPAAGPP